MDIKVESLFFLLFSQLKLCLCYVYRVYVFMLIASLSKQHIYYFDLFFPDNLTWQYNKRKWQWYCVA